MFDASLRNLIEASTNSMKSGWACLMCKWKNGLRETNADMEIGLYQTNVEGMCALPADMARGTHGYLAGEIGI